MVGYLRGNLAGRFGASKCPMAGTATVDATGLLVRGPACHEVDLGLTSHMWMNQMRFDSRVLGMEMRAARPEPLGAE